VDVSGRGILGFGAGTQRPHQPSLHCVTDQIKTNQSKQRW
jgi:hypothetical protein